MSAKFLCAEYSKPKSVDPVEDFVSLSSVCFIPQSNQRNSVLSSLSGQQAWLATCPKGLEQLLAQELQQLGAESVKETVAAVHFTGSRELAYRVCLWSRLANRVLMPLREFMLDDAEQLYQECLDIPWEAHF